MKILVLIFIVVSSNLQAQHDFYSNKVESAVYKKIKHDNLDESPLKLSRLIASGNYFTVDEAKYYVVAFTPRDKVDLTDLFGSYRFQDKVHAGALMPQYHCLYIISKSDPLWCLEWLFSDYLHMGMYIKSINNTKINHGWIPNIEILIEEGKVSPKSNYGLLAAVISGWSESNNKQYNEWVDLLEEFNEDHKLDGEYSFEYYREK